MYRCVDVVVFASVTQHETFGIANIVRALVLAGQGGEAYCSCVCDTRSETGAVMCDCDHDYDYDNDGSSDLLGGA